MPFLAQRLAQRALSRSTLRFTPFQGLLAVVDPSAGYVGLRGMANSAVVIHVTAPDHKVASSVAKKLVEKKLAACVQTVSGVESTYWWEGKVETEKEYLLLIKTQKVLTDQVVREVSSLHPYDVPEVIATPIEGGSEKYMKWIQESTTSKQ